MRRSGSGLRQHAVIEHAPRVLDEPGRRAAARPPQPSPLSGTSWNFRDIPVAAAAPAISPLGPQHRVLAGGPMIQAKLAIGPVDDPLEREADRVADRIMRMPASDLPDDVRPASEGVLRRACWLCEDSGEAEAPVRRAVEGTLLRDISRDEIQESLVQAYLTAGDTETMQRQVADAADEEQTTEGERILMQAKPSGALRARPGPDLETAARSLEGGGHPLPAPLRQRMEPRFGHDFSAVRVHADATAGAMARLVNARAFTIGRNIVFAPGEYAPGGSADGQRLLAHELTHVIQQGRAGRRLQRQIVVGGKPYTPSAKYLAYLDKTFGAAMKEFVEQMHNGGSPPVFSFSSYEQMGYEVRIRAGAIQGIEDVHKGCCNYYDSAHPPYLDSTYWDHVGTGVDFKLKSPLPTGKQPSDAVEAIFAPGAGTRVECRAMSRAIEYRSMLKGLGAAKFNALFPGGAGIDISLGSPFPLITGPDNKYEVKTVASKAEILPGDRVYFKNFHDYTTRVPGGFWQGENATALGGGKYRGFGVAALSENDLNQELVNRYNNDAVPHLSKTVADLIADGGGLQLDPVIRPIIKRIAP